MAKSVYCCELFAIALQGETIFYWIPEKQWQVIEGRCRFTPLFVISYCPFCGTKL
jgi:hypothetical protein